MEDQELKKIWQESSEKEDIHLELKHLKTELKSKMEKVDKNIRRRDQREIYASVFGILLFIVLAWDIPYPITKFACLLNIGWFIYVIYRLKTARKLEQPDPGLNFKEQLAQRKEYLKGQAHLLNSVLYWYVLPPFLINIIFFMGAGDPDLWDSPISFGLPSELPKKILVIGFLAIFYAFIVWLNRKAARENFSPLIKRVEKMEKELENE